MPHRAGNFFHLHLVSDATGETLLTVARAAAAQYVNVSPVEHIHPLVRSRKQLDRILDELDDAPGIVLYTLLDRELADPLEEKCRALGLPFLTRRIFRSPTNLWNHNRIHPDQHSQVSQCTAGITPLIGDWMWIESHESNP